MTCKQGRARGCWGASRCGKETLGTHRGEQLAMPVDDVVRASRPKELQTWGSERVLVGSSAGLLAGCGGTKRRDLRGQSVATRRSIHLARCRAA